MTHTVKELSKSIMNCNTYDELLQDATTINNFKKSFTAIELSIINIAVRTRMKLIEMSLI